MGKEIRSLPVSAEFRVTDNDDGSVTITGHPAVFGKWSEDMMGFRERVAKGAFARTLKEGADVRALWNHDGNFVLGRTKSGTLRLSEDDTGLHMELDAPNTPTIRDLVIEPIRRGDVDQMSFGFVTKKDEWKRGEDNEIDERTLLDVDLFDVSPVTYPAYPDTDVAVRAKRHEAWQQEMDAFEQKRKDEQERIEFKCREYDLI